jgi:hypothetical protein
MCALEKAKGSYRVIRSVASLSLLAGAVRRARLRRGLLRRIEEPGKARRKRVLGPLVNPVVVNPEAQREEDRATMLGSPHYF